MQNEFLDVSIKTSQTSRILAREQPYILRQLHYDSGIIQNIWNTGLIEVIDKEGKQIKTQQISNKPTLLAILDYVDTELSKQIQHTVE